VSESRLHSNVDVATGAVDGEAADVIDETSGFADEPADADDAAAGTESVEVEATDVEATDLEAAVDEATDDEATDDEATDAEATTIARQTAGSCQITSLDPDPGVPGLALADATGTLTVDRIEAALGRASRRGPG